MQFSVKFQVVRIRLCPNYSAPPCPPGAEHTWMSTATFPLNCICRSRYRAGFCSQAAVQWARQRNSKCSGQRYLGEAETTAGLTSGRDKDRHYVNQRKGRKTLTSPSSHPAASCPSLPASQRPPDRRTEKMHPVVISLHDNAGTLLNKPEAKHTKK